MEHPRELPRSAVDEAVARSYQKRRIADRDARIRATAYGTAALTLLANLFSNRVGGAGFVMLGSKSARKPAEIVAELKDFYGRRPRPWRPAAYAGKVHRRR